MSCHKDNDSVCYQKLPYCGPNSASSLGCLFLMWIGKLILDVDIHPFGIFGVLGILPVLQWIS